MLKGSEWWYGFLSRMETISIREGLDSRSPFRCVRSTDRWQYTAYLPTSLLGGQKWKKSEGVAPQGGKDVFGGSPRVGVALQVLFQVPQEVLLREKESDTQRQQLPALWESREHPFYDQPPGVDNKTTSCCARLRQGVVVRRPLVGLLDELTVHLILELRVRQAHLQSVLSQRGVVIHGGRLHQHVDEELAGLREKGRLHLAASRGRHTRTFVRRF